MTLSTSSILTIAHIPIAVQKKNIKHTHLSVHPPFGQVRISAPLHTSEESIRLFAISRLPWIYKQQKRFYTQLYESPRQYISGEDHYFLGQRYILRVHTITDDLLPHVSLTRKKYLDMYVRAESTLLERQTLLYSWYQEQGEKIIPPLLHKYTTLTGLQPSKYSLKHMRTRWGSCSPRTRNISLNIQLLRQPQKHIEYIILHELVHLVETSHNTHFQDLMTQYMPHWRYIQTELQTTILPCSSGKL